MDINITSQFNELLKTNNHSELLVLLKDFIKSNTLTIKERGWAYWNISDRHALMRQPDLEYENLKEFVNWGKQYLNPDKLHWFVSDGTQALTLSLGNYFKDWFDWYLYACDNSTKNPANRMARFESHKTSASALVKLKRLDNIDVPFSNMYELLQEERENWDNSVYCNVAYYTLVIKKDYLLKQTENITPTLNKLNQILNQNLNQWDHLAEYDNRDLLGSWRDLNAPRVSQRSMLTSLHNLGCALSIAERYHESVDIFQKALSRGHHLNDYGMKLYQASLQNSGQSMEQIRSDRT